VLISTLTLRALTSNVAGSKPSKVALRPVALTAIQERWSLASAGLSIAMPIPPVFVLAKRKPMPAAPMKTDVIPR
jgi:hypothetical protein